MAVGSTQCAHCRMPIIEPRTQVVRDGQTYCCPNCAAAAERGSSEAPAGARCCAECGVPIVDESTMQVRAGEAFCCANCFDAIESFDEPPPTGGGSR